jgi:hypothetical protein
MNLNRLAAGIVGAVNPQVSISVQLSTGSTTNPDGTQTPTYTTSTATGQVQPLGSQDLRRLDGLNIQGVTAKVYLNGDFEGVFRVLGKGGDLLTFNGQTYLVTAVLERWPDWTCVGVTMQLGA